MAKYTKTTLRIIYKLIEFLKSDRFVSFAFKYLYDKLKAYLGERKAKEAIKPDKK